MAYSETADRNALGAAPLRPGTRPIPVRGEASRACGKVR